MHELSLAYSLIELAEDQLRALPQPVPRVERVGVRLGALSGIAEEALHFCFDAASRGTMLEGAVLEVEQLPLRAFCPICQTEQPLPMRTTCTPLRPNIRMFEVSAKTGEDGVHCCVAWRSA